jgi:hypothetical protein
MFGIFFFVVISFAYYIHSEMLKVGFVILIEYDWQVNLNLPQYAALQIVSCHFGVPIIAWFFSASVFIVY